MTRIYKLKMVLIELFDPCKSVLSVVRFGFCAKARRSSNQGKILSTKYQIPNMRIFIALDIPGEVRARLTEYMERARALAPQARWARVEGLHVTLKFVGHVSDERVEQIKAALASIKTAPFAVRFEGIGFFPNPKAARVFWAGVGSTELPALASAIDAALEKLGVE